MNINNFTTLSTKRSYVYGITLSYISQCLQCIMSITPYSILNQWNIQTYLTYCDKVVSDSYLTSDIQSHLHLGVSGVGEEHDRF